MARYTMSSLKIGWGRKSLVCKRETFEFEAECLEEAMFRVEQEQGLVADTIARRNGVSPLELPNATLQFVWERVFSPELA